MILPLLPRVALPVLTTTIPLTPLKPALAVVMVNEPDENEPLVPVAIVTKPPVAPLDIPAVMETWPPIPQSPDPTVIEIAPPRPLPDVDPEPTMILPLFPLAEVPVLNTSIPLIPLTPALAVVRIIAPLADDPAPVTTVIAPPVE
jgi:hypothetical protein